MDKKGHWYTDKNGHHYFVEDGQTPQEGWEASKRRKMIDGGKYKVSEDGDNWEDVDEDTYNKYEADKSEFDENIDDDFGFDEEDDEYNREMEKAQEENAMMSEGEDEPTPEDEKQYVDKIMDDIAKANDKNAFEYVSGNIDDCTEAGLISEETSDRLYEELDKKIDASGERMPLYNSKMSKQSEPTEEDANTKEEKYLKEFPEDADKIKELKEKFKGKDYETALDRFTKGEAFGDVLNGVIQYEEDAKKPENEERPAPHSMRDYVYDEQNPIEYPDKKHQPTPNQKKGLVKETLVDKFNDAHLYNDGGKFQLALGNGKTEEFNTYNEAIDRLSEYTGKDYSWAKRKAEMADKQKQTLTIRENMNPRDKEIAEYINKLSEDEAYWLFDALRSRFGK